MNIDKHNVLVVDDEQLVAGSIERALRSNDFGVSVANSGVEGLNLARRHRPQMMVLDVMMPGMDGFEVCRQVRSDPLLGELPILFLTARGGDEDKIAGLRAGADDYLTKPFNVMSWCCAFAQFCGAVGAAKWAKLPRPPTRF